MSNAIQDRKEKILSVSKKLNRHIVVFGRRHSTKRYDELKFTYEKLFSQWGKARNA
jgi:hypothetical protein